MKELGIFNSVNVYQPAQISANYLRDLKYGGFMTVTNSGDGTNLLEAFKLAYSNKLTCFNVVNTENSPITKLIDEI